MKRRVKKQVGEEAIRRLEEKAMEREKERSGTEAGYQSHGGTGTDLANGNAVATGTTTTSGQNRSPRREGIVHPARQGTEDLGNLARLEDDTSS